MSSISPDDGTSVEDLDPLSDPTPTDRGRWISALVVLAGGWLLVEPFLFDVFALNRWNDAIVGGLLLVLGGYNYYRRANGMLASTVAAAFVAVSGMWVVILPVVLEMGFPATTSDIGFWNDIAVGLFVLVLGFSSVYEVRDVRVRSATGQ